VLHVCPSSDSSKDTLSYGTLLLLQLLLQLFCTTWS
jgi:hypothetical protein